MDGKDEIKLLKLTRDFGTSLDVFVDGIRANIKFVGVSRQGVHMEIRAPLGFEFLRQNAKVRVREKA